jgi:hypothetical protein
LFEMKFLNLKRFFEPEIGQSEEPISVAESRECVSSSPRPVPAQNSAVIE